MQIYKITNLINNKIYIGKDTTSDKNYFGSGILIKRSIEKYGRENFIKEVIEETDDYNTLSVKEKYWIEFFNSTNPDIGYNISKGGDGGDTLTNNPNLDSIREKISKNNPKKGKTYEEAFGIEKANSYKKNLSLSNIQPLKGKTYEEYFGIDKSNEIKNKLSKSSSGPIEERWKSHIRVVEFKKQLSLNSVNNILKEEVKEKNRKRLQKKWADFRQEYIDRINVLKNFINIYGLDFYLDIIMQEIKRIPNSVFGKREEFYIFLGPDITNEIKIHFKNQRNQINKNINISKYKPISIDGVEYESITKASKDLNLERSLIKYRLKSKNFTEYFYI